MKLNEFIANVLKDIDNGLAEATATTGRGYHIEASKERGVNFDIAVTTINSSGTQAEGRASAGFVEVLGAGVGVKLDEKKENSEVSRIQFSVFVPIRTKVEEEDAMRRVNAANEQRRIEMANRY